MIPELTADDSGLRAMVERLEVLSGDFRPEMKATGEIVAARIGRNFDQAKERYPLKDATVRARERRARRTGQQPVVGMDTPLRAFEDRLYKAATATRPGVDGSAYELTPTSVTIGVDEGRIVFARAVLLGRQIPTPIPARPVIEVGPEEEALIAAEMDRGMTRRIAAAERGL